MIGFSPLRPRAATKKFAVVAALALLVAGCTDSSGDREDVDGRPTAAATAPAAPVLDDCAALTEPPEHAVDPPDTGNSAPDTESLPEITLPCLVDDVPVPLDTVAGPALINLWATWCPPCRAELPILQDFADRHRGDVHVLGVVTEDRRDHAAAFAQDAGVTFPALYDRQGQVRAAVGAFLPTTFFIDSNGDVRYLHIGELDQVTLAELAAEYLEVSLL